MDLIEKIRKIIVNISAVEETVSFALDSSRFPLEAESVIAVLRQNQKNIGKILEILEKMTKDAKSNQMEK